MKKGETEDMAEPKYMKNLHICISSITGTPRIVNIDLDKIEKKPYIITEKYKDIPKDEWDSALINYFSCFEPNQRQFAVGKTGWSFFIGGNCETPESLITCLKGCIREVEELQAKEKEDILK